MVLWSATFYSSHFSEEIKQTWEVVREGIEGRAEMFAEGDESATRSNNGAMGGGISSQII